MLFEAYNQIKLYRRIAPRIIYDVMFCLALEWYVFAFLSALPLLFGSFSAMTSSGFFFSRLHRGDDELGFSFSLTLSHAGNGWVAAGMLRVLGTINNSQYNTSIQSEQIDLVDWVTEIHDGMYKNLVSHINSFFPSYILTSYAYSPSSPPPIQDSNYVGITQTNFYDAAFTALMVSTVYRLSILAGVDTYIPQSENSRKALLRGSSRGSGGVATV